MTSERILRERQLWIAAVAVLVTASGWLALVNAALLVHALAPRLDGWVVTLRVLLRTLATIAHFAAPIVVAAAAGALVIAWAATAAPERGSQGGHRV